jgi:hypothetical protein
MMIAELREFRRHISVVLDRIEDATLHGRRECRIPTRGVLGLRGTRGNAAIARLSRALGEIGYEVCPRAETIDGRSDYVLHIGW